MDKDNKFYINKALIWDYDFKRDYNTEEFKKWYISRVLSCGTKEDLRQLGITMIRQYFLKLNLPNGIRGFWKWYFNYAHI